MYCFNVVFFSSSLFFHSSELFFIIFCFYLQRVKKKPMTVFILSFVSCKVCIRRKISVLIWKCNHPTSRKPYDFNVNLYSVTRFNSNRNWRKTEWRRRWNKQKQRTKINWLAFDLSISGILLPRQSRALMIFSSVV